MFKSDQSVANLVRQNSHRIPDDDAKAQLGEIRQRFLSLSLYIDDSLPPSRERSCALTKLDEARMWACNAATMSGEVVEQLEVRT